MRRFIRYSLLIATGFCLSNTSAIATEKADQNKLDKALSENIQTISDSNIQEVSLTPKINIPVEERIQKVIRKQLQAIRDRDADLAYALTTEKFHKKYDDAKDYLNTMRFDYRPIYNHKMYSFGEQNPIGTAYLQHVSMEDEYGQKVLVLFRVEEHAGKMSIASFAVINTTEDPL